MPIKDSKPHGERREPEAQANNHLGLELAQLLTQVPLGDVDLLMEIMQTYIKEHSITLGTDDYRVLLDEIERHEKGNITTRQKYFRILFLACTENSQTEVE